MKRILSSIKLLMVPSGKRPRRIRTGIFKDLMMELDLSCQTQLYLGLYERELYKWVRKLSEDINCAIDVGAGEGVYTLYFLAKTPAKKVLAFEPVKDNQALIKSNLRLNHLADDRRLLVHSKFVGKAGGEREISLNSLLSFISPPTMVKIDVDGAESEILENALEVLRLPGVRWVIETHSRELEEECMRILNKEGYAVNVINNAWWRIVIPELRIGPLGTHNRWLVAIKD